jgi:cytochrome b
MSAEQARPVRVRIWDGWVRLSHWLIVILVAVAWWSGEKGQLNWHRLAGYGALGVVLFRLWWGFFGSETARFKSFVRRPGAVAAYASRLFARGHEPSPGHNPMGGWSVVALIVLLLAECLLGLFAVDIDGLESGPLAWMVSFERGRSAALLHHWIFNALLVLVAVHLVAIGFYLVVRRENLIGAMIGGYKRLAAQPPAPLRFGSWGMALLGIALAGALAWLLANGERWTGWLR